MNREHDSPAEWNPGAGSADERRKLVEIERRLKETRPRPPALDWAALEQVADADRVELASRRELDDLNRSGCQRRVRPYGPFLAMAGSWICGAAVGVLVTLLIVPRPSLIGRPADALVRHDDRVAELADETGTESEDVQPEETVLEEIRPVAAAAAVDLPSERTSLDETMLAAIAAPFGHSLGQEIESPALSVGMLLRKSIGRSSETPLVAADAERPGLNDTASDPPLGSTVIDLVPPRPSTRERLLEQLLRETSGFLVF